MKKLSVFITGLLLLATMTPQARAQNQNQNSDFFVGEWNVTISGTPQGDASFVISFIRNEENKLVGQILMEGTPFASLYNVTEKENFIITALFSIGNYELDLLFEKKGDNNFEGMTAGMFVTKGVRIEEEDCGC